MNYLLHCIIIEIFMAIYCYLFGSNAFHVPQKNKKYLILLLSPEKFVILNMREHKLMKSAERRDTDASKRTGRDDIHKSKTVS